MISSFPFQEVSVIAIISVILEKIVQQVFKNIVLKQIVVFYSGCFAFCHMRLLLGGLQIY